MAEQSNPFNPELWREVTGFSFDDITYHRHIGEGRANGIVRIAFDRPEVRNAFRPHTVDELYRALDHARRSPDVGTILLTGNGPSPKDDGWAFCSGGDQRIRGRSGYQYATEHDSNVDHADACISSRFSGSFGRCPRLSSVWLMGGLPVAGTVCMLCAT